jgi:hypothetical protein
MGAIAEVNAQRGHYFWSRDTRRFFGDSPSYWRVKQIGGRVFIIKRKPSRNAPPGCGGVGQVREFDPETGSIGCPMDVAACDKAGL